MGRRRSMPSTTSFRGLGAHSSAWSGRRAAAKSTFPQPVSGVEKPTSGKVTVTAESRTRGSDTSPVNHDYFHGGRSLDNMVSRPRRGWPQGACAGNDAAVFGDGRQLAHAAGMYPAQLSGGMRQRIGIARAPVDRAGLAADGRTVQPPRRNHGPQSARTEMQQLWQASGATVLFVTHDVNEAVQLSDRILMMNKGGTLCADILISLPRPRACRPIATLVTSRLMFSPCSNKCALAPVGAESAEEPPLNAASHRLLPYSARDHSPRQHR